MADPSVALAFTWSGLKAMGLDPDALGSFSLEFREGMHQIDRSRRLGDWYDNPAWATVIDGGPVWSGNIPDAYPRPDQVYRQTPITAHAVLMLYAATPAALNALIATAETSLGARGIAVGRDIRLQMRPLGGAIPKEHFGFADGVSQPVPYGDAIVTPAGQPVPHPIHGVPAGEIIMGQPNAHSEIAGGPLVVETDARASHLAADTAPPGYRDLGRNGSYLVVRELRQDVAAFWQSMDEEAKRQNHPAIDADGIAERIVGRKLDGSPLLPGTPSFNDFSFSRSDPYGQSCPFGSHVRRANPRDGLGRPGVDSPESLLVSVNSHRILRRGRKFGDAIANNRRDDKTERGLLFMCLNTDIARQFEFIQETWLLNPGLAGLRGEVDPLLGPPGRFTIPDTAFRRRPEVRSYVRMAGGEYFFLPSIAALDYLQTL